MFPGQLWPRNSVAVSIGSFEAIFNIFILKVRSRSGEKRSNLHFHKCHQKRYLPGPVKAQKTDGALYYVMVRP